MTQANALSRERFDAVIFDLDGVITSTAQQHARAWKMMFDELLAGRRTAPQIPAFNPFAIDPDYYRYVDGKPRYDGVASFLDARGVALPSGNLSDAAGALTICGLGNRKNEIFLQLLEREPATAYPSSLALVKNLRAAGYAVAVISSSRNCNAVLHSVGALDLFDVRIDGNDSERLGLPGKPAPDIFLAAAEALAVDPARAVVVEDAIAGVQAGCAGGFGLVIGVDRDQHGAELAAAGADLVVVDLAEITVAATDIPPPSALGRIDEIRARIDRRSPVILLDYDGTLTPIVDRPELAVLSPTMQAVLTQVATKYPTAVVSGRDLDDVRALVGIEQILYAGSHGFDIGLADGTRRNPDRAGEALGDLQRAEAQLREQLDRIAGVLVERKRYAIAVHYRLVAQTDLQAVEQAVDAALANAPGLRKRGGKKIFELIPNLPWDKGTTVTWLLQNLNTNDSSSVPIYLGDDLTDEDAFEAIQSNGIGIAVMDRAHPTHASYSLRSPEEVRRFLCQLIDGDETE